MPGHWRVIACHTGVGVCYNAHGLNLLADDYPLRLAIFREKRQSSCDGCALHSDPRVLPRLCNDARSLVRYYARALRLGATAGLRESSSSRREVCVSVARVRARVCVPEVRVAALPQRTECAKLLRHDSWTSIGATHWSCADLLIKVVTTCVRYTGLSASRFAHLVPHCCTSCAAPSAQSAHTFSHSLSLFVVKRYVKRELSGRSHEGVGCTMKVRAPAMDCAVFLQFLHPFTQRLCVFRPVDRRLLRAVPKCYDGVKIPLRSNRHERVDESCHPALWGWLASRCSWSLAIWQGQRGTMSDAGSHQPH